MSWTVRCLTVSSLLVLGFVAQTHAEAPTSIRLEYDAPPGCPSSELFVGQVLARTRRALFSSQKHDLTFVVRLSKQEGGFDGQLGIVDQLGKQLTRSMEGLECGDVVSALALVAALAIDPAASTAPSADLTPTAASQTRVEAAPQLTIPPRPQPPAIVGRPSFTATSGVGMAVTSGPAPEPLISPVVFVEGMGPSFGGYPGSVRLGMLGASTGFIGPESSLASFHWYASRLTLCPRHFPASSRGTVALCGVSDIGALRTRGEAAALPETATRAWMSLGLWGTARWIPTTGFFVEIGGGAHVALTRDEWVFDAPFVRVYRPGLIGLTGQLSTGLTIF